MEEEKQMTEYVKKSEVLDTLWKADGITYHGIEVLNHMPAEDVVEVKRGEWRYKPLDKFRKYEVVCSECGTKYIGNYDAYDEPYDFNYCPRCGARMEASDGQ